VINGRLFLGGKEKKIGGALRNNRKNPYIEQESFSDRLMLCFVGKKFGRKCRKNSVMEQGIYKWFIDFQL
jgi:hypothetical protein